MCVLFCVFDGTAAVGALIAAISGWFKATQAMITIGFIGSWFAMICISLYMCMCLNLVKKTFLLVGVILSSAFSSTY